MISLRQIAKDLDKMEELQRATVESYAHSIGATRQFAIVAERNEAEAFKERLSALEKQLLGHPSPEVSKQVETALRAELQQYQEKAQQRISQLHQDVGAAAVAMKAFAENMSSNSDDHEKQLQGELKNLKILTRSDSLSEIKGGIQNSTSAIEASYEQLRKSNQLVIASLQDEIRLLHKAIETEKKAVLTDKHSGAWNRHRIEGRIEELIKQNETFSILLIRIRNLSRITEKFSPPMVDGALKMMLSNFQQMFGKDVMVGRWNNEDFAAILSLLPSDSVALCREVNRKLSVDYSVPELGIVHVIALQVTSAVVDRRTGDDLAKLNKSLEKSVDALYKL